MSELANELTAVICRHFPSVTVVSPANTSTQPCLLIPAHHPDVGAVRVSVDGDEVVIEIGEHAHGHFATYDDPSPESTRAGTIESVVAFLDDLFADRVVFWSADGSGGWYYPDIPVASPFPIPIAARKYRWSGPIP